MEHQSLLMLILTGGILGAIGQSIRIIIGLKKWYEDKHLNADKADAFDSKRFWVSLLMGFVAGSLGILFYNEGTVNLENKKSLITLIAIGYSGVDFIEGLISKYIPKPK